MDETGKRGKQILKFTIKRKPPISSSSKEVASKGMPHWISAITLTLSILSIVLYSAGKAYRIAYLAEYGVNDWSIPWSVQDLIYLGAISKLTVLVFAPLIIFIAIISFFIICIIIDLIIKFLKSRFPLKIKIIKIKMRDDKKSRDKMKNKEAFARIFEIPLVAVAASIFIILPCTVFVGVVELEGAKKAIAEKQIFLASPSANSQDKIPFARITRRVQGQDISNSGYIISCTEKACAMFQVFDFSGKRFGKTMIIPLDAVLEFSGPEIKK